MEPAGQACVCPLERGHWRLWLMAHARQTGLAPSNRTRLERFETQNFYCLKCDLEAYTVSIEGANP